MSADATSLQQPADPASVATYGRVVEASLERIWENVLDWEHLPWLHAGTFSGIRLLGADEQGWRAVATLSAEHGGGETDVEVRLDRDNLRYTTRTAVEALLVTEIVTVLDPVGPHQTRIEVDFRVAGIDATQAAELGDYYKKLYTRLWDEDEVMMMARERCLATARDRAPAGALDDGEREAIVLGPIGELRARLPLLVETGGRLFRIVDHEGELLVHAARCPHRGGSLDVTIESGCVRCPWHGYSFDVTTGLSSDGRALRLERAPRAVVDEASGDVLLQWDRS